MRLTYNWLKDFVEIKLPAEELAEKLTMAGLEVTALEKRDGDAVFEIEITSNRPDWLSVIGIAREVAAITGQKLKKILNPKFKVFNKSLQLKAYSLKLEIEDKKDCPLYTAKIIRGIKVAPSPEWLRKRLELIGCRSINNIVDITNYILFNYGEPLHAFDLDKLNLPGLKSWDSSRAEKTRCHSSHGLKPGNFCEGLSQGAISVRRGKHGESFTAIDEEKRTLGQEILVIADREKAVALAGIMGGKDSEVSFATKNILLEAAIFDPVLTRRARRKLGIQTDSSYRFERGVDCETVKAASEAACALIHDLAGGELVLAKAVGINAPKKTKILLDAPRVVEILGCNISPARIKAILCGLGFGVKTKSKAKFSVEAPLFRQDVSLPEDLIEEIARIYGYENIPANTPRVLPKIIPDKERETIALLKNTLIGLGLNEAITYSLVDKGLLELCGFDAQDCVAIENPLSREQEVLRSTLIPSLAEAVADNLNQKQNYVAIFEVAKIFSLPAKEEWGLAIALCGEKNLLLENGLVRQKIGLLHLKGAIEKALLQLGITDYAFQAEVGGRITLKIGKDTVGTLYALSRQALEGLEIKNKEVVAGEILLEKVFPHLNLEKKLSPLPLYPGINRDISLVVKNTVSAGELIAAIKEKAGLLLKDARVTDHYQGKQIPSGSIGLTISCLYRSDERTLTEDQVNPPHEAVLEHLKERFAVQIR